MSKPFRCMDCGKEFDFDYSGLGIDVDINDPEDIKNKIKKYNQSYGIFYQVNMCNSCLQPLKTSKDFSLNIKREDEVNKQETSKKYIADLKDKFKNEEEELIKKYSAEEEEKKLKELNDLKKVVEENESNLKNLIKELENVEDQENNFCDDFKDLEMKIYSVEKDLSISNDIKLDYENKIKSFSGTNIFSELFQISFNDKYGIINGCKFCDPTVSNNSDSINGGWGYIVLLTKILSIKYNFESKKYDLIPNGNFSEIAVKGGERHEIIITDVKIRDKFNNAMCMYLEYLEEFLNFLIKEGKIETKNEEICPKITGDKINNKCIKIENGKEKLEDWYQCMKYLLTILKFLICQVLIDENKAYKETIDNIDIINNSKITNNVTNNKE